MDGYQVLQFFIIDLTVKQAFYILKPYHEYHKILNDMNKSCLFIYIQKYNFRIIYLLILIFQKIIVIFNLCYCKGCYQYQQRN